jgi:CDP-diacylglycerol--glycerol-3-phosphate 3-phosphatidyltransferase
MKFIPISLIYTRLLLGLLLVTFSAVNISHYEFIAITFLTVGLLTDIFDGIIARRLNISTQLLRRLDSTVDLIFFICVAVATYLQSSAFFRSNEWMLGILLGAEALTYVVSYLKFGKEVATHTIGAKLWTLLLFAVLIQLILTSDSGVLFNLMFWAGLITRLEIILIVLVLKDWTSDVPGIFQAFKLRRGEEIKRNKLFNG